MVYVDNMRAPYGKMIMCHMVADTTEELLAMADKIGVQRKWIQDKGTHREHFDISLAKRALAVKFGAEQITMKRTGHIIHRKWAQENTNETGETDGTDSGPYRAD